MPGEISHDGLGEMQGREFSEELSVNVPMEIPKSPEEMAVDLNLNKKNPGIISENKEREAENGKQDSISGRIRQELRALPRIDSENYQGLTKQVAERLGIKRKEDMDLLEAKFGVRRNIYQNLEKVKMMDKEGKEKVYRDFALEDSKWMQKVGDCIKNIKASEIIPEKDKKKEIDNVWREMKEIYDDYEIYYKDFKIAGGKETDNFESNKNGILGQVAAEELFKKADAAFRERGICGIRVEAATPQEDVDKKIDFYIVIEFGKNSSKVIPCQVKARGFDSKSGAFIASNLVVRVSDDLREGLKISARDKNPSNCEIKTIEDLEIFRKRALKEFKEGLFIIVPHGKAEIGKKEKVNLLEEDGEVHKSIEKGFLKQLSKKLFNIDIFEESVTISKQKKQRKEDVINGR